MNKPKLFSKGLGFACMISMIFGMVCVPALASAPLPSDAKLITTTQNNTVVGFNPSGTSGSPNDIAAITYSLKTRLLVVRWSVTSFNQIKHPDMPTKIVGPWSDTEESWLETALNSYEIEYLPTNVVPESLIPDALIAGVIDAVLVTSHPSSLMQGGIESEVFRLLPWSEEAVAAVVETYPNSVIPAQLPANAYDEQSAILGYVPLMDALQLGPVTPGGTEFNEVGFDRTVSVNIGIPQADITVNFASDNPPISDPLGDMLLGTATTDSNGDAQFTYHSDFQRRDSIYAYIDANENVNWDDPDEPRSDPPNTVKVWLENFVTGGGKINDANGEVIWSFDGNVSIADNQIIGNFQLVDHVGSRPGYTGETPVSYYCEDFISMNTPGFDLAESPRARHNTIDFTGNFTNDRNDETVTLTITIMDLSDPGAGIDMIGVKTGMQPPDPESIAWIGTIPESPPPLIIPEIISIGNFQVHNLVKHQLPPPNAFQKGMNFGDWKPFDSELYGLYTPPRTDQSLLNLAATGANWIALIVRGGQETIESTEIFTDSPATATDEELRRVVDLAHSLGMRVMLKPHVHLSDDPTHGHVHIGNAFETEEQWQDWFDSYRQFIDHYATLAKDTHADMFCIGQELRGTVGRDADWRSIAQGVRQIYKGPIIYEATTYESQGSSEDQLINWWDAVDYIGVLGYFPLTESNDPTVEELKSAWIEKGYLSRLETLSQEYDRPVIISEIGYASQDGTNYNPANDPEAPIDLQEQADCYQAALEVLWGKPWLAGIYWWQWLAEPAAGGPNSNTGTPQGKPAEQVLKSFYLSQ